MQLVTFSLDDNVKRPGVLFERANVITDLRFANHNDTLSVIAAGLATVNSPGTQDGCKLSDARIYAPLLNPPRIFCIGLNYRDHAVESEMAIPSVPVVFFKMQTAIIGPGEAIVLPRNTAEPDYEAEFAFVIGKGGFRIPASAWREHVYGYTILNDVSARDVQLSSSQWSLGKSFPTFCPMGPAIVTADEIADPHNLAISLSIAGEVLQNSNTRELIFKIPDLIEYISSVTPLLPGDVISTGTPAGVGMGRKPQRWLKPGDTVTVTVEGIGSLTNPVASEPNAS
jgi:2-keto-4-pentenoate hydratase/2-oxohepta-3-ene-1,7-dioic acid hydratase in catechol pathway